MMCSDVSRLWLEILSVKGIGISRWIRLSRTVSVESITRMLGNKDGRAELGRLMGRRVGEPDLGFVEKQIVHAKSKGYGIASVSDPSYPRLLREIHYPPPILFYRGDMLIFDQPAICMVGSRKASRRGLLLAKELAFELSRRGFVVVSGMARGIDTAAHRGALGGEGGTCAVLGCGIDVPYPPENAALTVDISKRGCILSEFPHGTPPLKHNFPLRNRVLSGLSLGVVVVEAGIDSGAMGTARWACEQNREVFAVPGPVEHGGSRGPHRLIREGAYLVESVEDILSQLPPCGRVVASTSQVGKNYPHGSYSEPESKVISALDLNPKHIDELVQICHISATSLLPILLELEIRGVVESCGGGSYALAAD